jgi:hypothetical protein
MKNTALLSSLCLLIAACGGDTIDATPPPWDVPQPLPFKQGIYKVTLEIERDECTPSLKLIQELNSEWPSRHDLGRFYINLSNDIYFDAIIIGCTHPRTGAEIPETYTNMLYLTGYNEQKTLNTIKNKIKHDSPPQTPLRQYSEQLYNQCIKSKQNNSFDETITTSYINDSEIEIAFNSTWTLQDACYDLDSSTGYSLAIMPKTSCTEKYKLRYTLERECPRDCVPDGVAESDSVYLNEREWQRSIVSRRENMTCICDGVNIWQ